MKLLLDTHAFIWWDSAPNKLPPQILPLCQDQANVEGAILVSRDKIFEQYPVQLLW